MQDVVTAPVSPSAPDVPPVAMEVDETAAAASTGEAQQADSERLSVKERREMDAAFQQSRHEYHLRPSAVVTPEQQRAYDTHVQHELDKVRCVLCPVPGNGDCQLSSVVLGCEAAGIDLAHEQGLSSVHASTLRLFMAEWIRSHKERLYDISGGDDSWRGDPLPATRGTKRAGTGAAMTLDDCLDLYADTTERKHDIAWSSTDAQAGATSLGDYMPQLLAEALHLRIVLIQPGRPTATVGLRDTFNELVVGSERTIVMVQSVRQSHWDPALPIEAKSVPVAPATPSASSVASSEVDTASHGARQRLFADLPGDVAKQLAEAQLALETSQAEVTRLEADGEKRIDRVVKAVNRMQVLAQELQEMHVKHVERVRNGDDRRDEVAILLKRMLNAQHAVPTRAGVPFLHVSADLREAWKHDLETLESSLGSPLRSEDAMPVDSSSAQRVLALMAGWQHQLEDSDREWPFLELVVLSKKLYCIDQLLSAAPAAENAPYHLFELEATFLRLLTHARVWSFTVRLPCASIVRARTQMVKRSAGCFVKAAQVAAPNVLEQARILVEQCKMLEALGLMHKAQGLDSIELVYPEAPFTVLRELHARYEEAGPAMSRDDVEQHDEAVRRWQGRIDELESRADELSDRQGDAAEIERLRTEVDEMRKLPPHTFEVAMKRSQTFFHPDKRKKDLATSAEEKSTQFAQVKEAWSQLVAYRSRFEAVRMYRAKVAAMSV